MSAQVTNYKCPACGGPLHYDSESGKLRCDYCGSAYETAEIEKLYADQDEKASEALQKHNEWDTSGMEQWSSDPEGIRIYHCPSCGAELIYDETTAASSCPYCGNPTIIPGKLAGAFRPDYVIPFRLDKQAAEKALHAHYRGKYFLPRAFKQENHIRKIQGVYVPFWMFDGTAEGERYYEASKVRKYTQGDYEITETRFFDVYRSGSLAFEKVPVAGSEKMDHACMESVEPYDYRELRDFSTAFLTGYLADQYDVSAEQCRTRADRRCESTFDNCLRKTIKGYASIVEKDGNTELHRGSVHYALLPVWVLNTTWNNQTYTFMMNGQSGKMTGDLPVSKPLFWMTFAVLSAALTTVISMIVFL